MADQFGGIPVGTGTKPQKRDEFGGVLADEFGGVPVQSSSFSSSSSSSPVPGMEKLGGGAPPTPEFKRPLPNDLKPEDEQEQSFITSPHGLIRTGARKAMAGVAALTRPGLEEKANAALDIGEGVATATAPIWAPMAGAAAAAASPAAVIGGIGTGAVLGGVGEKAAEVLGAPRSVQRATGLVGNAVGGMLGAQAGPPVYNALRHPLRMEPVQGITRGMNPSGADADYFKKIPETLTDIKQSNPGVRLGEYKNGEVNLTSGANRTIQRLQAALDPWLTRAKGVPINGDEIVANVKAKIPTLLKTTDPGEVAAIVKEAQDTWGGKQFTPDEFRDFLIQGNAGLAKFRRRAAHMQGEALTSGSAPDTPVSPAELDAIRTSLYRTLDPEGQGRNIRYIQSRTGNAIQFRNDANLRNKDLIAAEPATLRERIDPVSSIVRGWIGPRGPSVGAGISSQGSVRPLSQIRRSFDAVPDTGNVLPKPPTDFYPSGNPQLMLGPGNIRVGSPGMTEAQLDASGIRGGRGVEVPDTSRVASTPAMVQPPNPRRAITQGDIIPPSDFSEPVFGPVQGHYPNAPNPRRALPEAGTFIQPKYPVPESPAGASVGATPSTQLPPVSEGSFVRSLPALINPKTGQPWTAEELKTLLGGFNPTSTPNRIIGGNIK